MPDSQHIVLTGCTRGLGRAMVDSFIAAGHRVSACGRNEAVIAELAKAYPAPHQFMAVDVSDAASVDEWARTVIDDAGAPDFLVNNAALINANAPLWEVPRDEFDAVVDVNIKGVANTVRAFVPAMIACGTGIIVNFSSGWGRSTSPEVAPYCATKFAIEGLTQALAQELPAGLAAVPLNPGIIDTEMLRSCFAEGAAGYPSAEEWAERAVPFILGLGPRQNGRSLSV